MALRNLLALAAVAHGLLTPARPCRLALAPTTLSRLAPLAAYNKWTDSYDTDKLKGAASKFVNKDGRLYAPWLEQQVDDAATARSRAEREQRSKAKYQKSVSDGLTGMSIEGASAELGGGLRMNAKVVETPATAEEHGHVQLSWSNKGGNISIEKYMGGSWRSIASRASSPVTDSDAAVGEQLYRAKNGREVIAQIGVSVESKDQQTGSMMILGGLGAVLLLAFVFGMHGDAIPNV
jgi:hypothetical protein